MNILVTGRESEKRPRMVSGHVLSFIQSAGEFERYEDRRPRYKKRPDIPDFDFALQHFGNPDTNDILSIWKEEGKIDEVILFHSGGKTEKAVACCKMFGIPLLTWLPTKESVLELKWDEVKLKIPLTNFALAKILQPKSIGVENLIAISILCQGYLAVHARKQNGVGGAKEIFPALKQMGWLDFIDGPGKSLLPKGKDLDERKSEVCQARWWLEPFELWHSEGIIREEWRKFEDSLMKEWGRNRTPLPKKIGDLLKPLKKGGNINEPKVVADAYCLIAENLGGALCRSK